MKRKTKDNLARFFEKLDETTDKEEGFNYATYIFGLVQSVLIILKWKGIIGVSWWVVMIPTLLNVALFILFLVLVAIAIIYKSEDDIDKIFD